MRTIASTLVALVVHGFAVGTLIGRPCPETAVFAAVTLALVAAQTMLTALRCRALEEALE